MYVIKTTAHLLEMTKGVRNDYYLLPQAIGTLTTVDIIRRLENKQIATHNVNGPAFIALFHEECIQAACEGYNVKTDLCHIRIGIHGIVYAQDLGHHLSAEQVDVRLNMVQSPEARSAVKYLTVHVAEQPAPTGPVIQTIWNPVRKEPDTLNAGAMVLIQGLRIAVRGELTDEIGVYFTSADGGTTIRIPAEELSPNMPTKLQFVLPATVTPGEWTVAVVTQTAGNSSVFAKNVRRNDYQNIVTVV